MKSLFICVFVIHILWHQSTGNIFECILR